MSIFWIIILGLVTSEVTLCTIIQAVAAYQSIKAAWQSHGTKKPNQSLLLRTVIMVAVAIVLGFLTVLASINTSSASQPLSRNNTPTSNYATSTVPSILGTTPIVTSTIPPLASTYVFGTEAKPLFLSCPDCVQDGLNIKVGIVRVTIYKSQGDSLWYIHFENHSGQSASNLQISQFDLTNITDPAQPILHCKSSTNIGNIAGKNENYNLSVHINCLPQTGATYNINIILRSNNGTFVQNDSENQGQYVPFTNQYVQPLSSN